MHLYFFCPPLQSIPADSWYLLGSVAACGCTVLAIGQEQPFVPLGRAQPRGLEPSAAPLRGSAWNKKILQKTPESSSYSIKWFPLTQSNQECLIL